VQKQEVKRSPKKLFATPTTTPIATPTLEKSSKMASESQTKLKIEKKDPKIAAKSVEFQRAKTADPKKLTNKSFVATIRTKNNIK